MFKKTVKSLLGRAMFFLRLHKSFLQGRAVVVAFHSVNDEATVSDINCTPKLFGRYCRFFARYFNVIPLSELLDKLDRDEDVSGDLVITFDDGYKDNHDIAAPILAKHDLPATFFVTAGFIESRDSAPWDAELSIQSEWMDWRDVRRLSDMGFDIGGHTMTHPSLANVTAEEADVEIRNCKRVLESELSLDVPHFAYPFGGVANISDERIAQVRDAAFRCCMSCHGGTVSRGDDAYRLRRAPITTRHHNPYDFGFDCVRGNA